MLRQALNTLVRQLTKNSESYAAKMLKKRPRLEIETLEMRWVPTTVSFASSTYSVNEDALTLNVVINLSNAPSSAVNVHYATSDSSAEAGTGKDYTSTSGTASFTQDPETFIWTTSIPVAIPINWDDVSESGETFTVTLSSPSAGLSLGATTTTTVTINNSSASTWTASGQHRVIDGPQGLRYPFGTLSVGVQDGDLSIRQGFDYGQGGAVFGQPALVYHSTSTSMKPVLEAALSIPAFYSGGTFTTTDAQLTWNGSTQSAVNFTPPVSPGGYTLEFGLPVSSVVTTTGIYSWSIQLRAHINGKGDIVRTVSGTAQVVVNNGAFGQGWGIDGFNQLVAVSGGQLMVYGGGGSRLFTGTSTFTSPANDYGTLVKNGNNTFTYTAKDQTQWNYDTSGNLTSIVDPHSLIRTFTYSSGNLSTVTEPDGGVTTFSYSSGKLATIVQPGSRTLTITIDGSSDLTNITDSDGSLHTLTYDGNHHLTNEKWGTLNATMTYDSTSRLLTNIDRGGSNTLGVASTVGKSLITNPNTTADKLNTVLSVAGFNTVTFTLDQAGRFISFQGNAGLLAGGGGSGSGTSASLTRDSAGNVTVYTDSLSQTTTYTYNGSGDLTQIKRPDNSLETFTYDSTYHKVLTDKDSLNHTTTYTYNAYGDLETVTDAASNVTTNTWSNGLLQTITDAANHTTTFTYDGNRRLQTFKDATGAVTTLTYDSSGNVQTVKDALARVTTYSYDAKHRVLTETNALSGVTTYTYNAQGQVTSVTDPLSNVTSYVYSAQGWNTSITEAVGTGIARTTTMTYYGIGYRATVTDALSHTTTYTYTTYGQVATVTDPLSHTSTYSYDSENQLTAVTNALGNTTSYTYNNRGWVTSVQNALTKFTTFTYDTEGNKLTSKDANNGVTTFSYDALNRVIAVTDPLSHTSTTVYDAVGNVQATVNALGNRTTYSYDAVNLVQTIKDQLANVTTYSYDAVGNQVTVTDALTNVTTFVYDDLNRRVNTIEPNGSKTTFIYDANSQMTGLIDPNSNRTTFVFDALGRQTQEITALNKTITYTYNAVDQLTQKKDRKSQTIDYTYDNAGRLTGEVWKNSGGTTTNTQTFTYDNANQLLTAKDANGTYTFTYDAAGQVLTQKDMWSTTLTITYDNVGNRTKVQDSFSGVETSVYDAANNLTSRRFGGIGGTSHRLDFTYTAINQMENIKRYNASSGGSMTSQTTYSYDAFGSTTGIKNADGSANVLSQYTYTYDVGNRLSTETLGGTTKTYTYDSRSQLTADGTTTYGYDNAGNRNNSSQSINTGNRLASDATYNYTYDDEGNLTSKVSIASPTVTWTYSWDVNNRLTAIDKSGGGSSLYNISYKYDVFGNRIEQVEDADGAGAGASITTRFALEGSKVQQDAWGNRTPPIGTENWNVWADLNGSNALQVRYVRGDATDELFSRVKSDGTMASYLTDRMGSIRQLVDASGAVQDTIAYDGFGNLLSESNVSFGDRWKWTGRELNTSTGLQYNRARYYSGQSGQWVSEDPIRYNANDYNTNRYIKNTTQISSDPSGLWDWFDNFAGWVFTGETPDSMNKRPIPSTINPNPGTKDPSLVGVFIDGMGDGLVRWFDLLFFEKNQRLHQEYERIQRENGENIGSDVAARISVGAIYSLPLVKFLKWYNDLNNPTEPNNGGGNGGGNGGDSGGGGGGGGGVFDPGIFGPKPGAPKPVQPVPPGAPSRPQPVQPILIGSLGIVEQNA